jgi:DNA ligase D-like protein (predicted 3'-phosphoesterase)
MLGVVTVSRFVVQLHDETRLHFDLRLQSGGVLRSWTVPRGPSLDPGIRRLAVPVEDHPLPAGDFEGVRAGQTRGTGAVITWDEGTAEMVHDVPGHLSFIVHGRKLSGAQRFRCHPDGCGNLTVSDRYRWNVTTIRWESCRWLPAGPRVLGWLSPCRAAATRRFRGGYLRLLLVPREPRVDWAAGLSAHIGAAEVDTGVERRQGGKEASYLRVLLRTHSVAIDLATSVSVPGA